MRSSVHTAAIQISHGIDRMSSEVFSVLSATAMICGMIGPMGLVLVAVTHAVRVGVALHRVTSGLHPMVFNPVLSPVNISVQDCVLDTAVALAGGGRIVQLAWLVAKLPVAILCWAVTLASIANV